MTANDHNLLLSCPTARKEAVKQAKNELNEKLKEDQLWKDEDKHVLRKQSRKEEKEKKKQDVAERKATNRAAYEEEMSSLKAKKAEDKSAKVSRFEIKESIERQNQMKENAIKVVTVDNEPLEENVNRMVGVEESARSIEDAIALLRYAQ